MPNKYYDSDSAGASAPYESETTAATALGDALGAIDGVDQIIWVKNTSAETFNAHTTLVSNAAYGTENNAQRIYGVSDWDASPGTLASGASISPSGNYNLIFQGNFDISHVGLDWSSVTVTNNISFGNTTASSVISV